LLEVPKMITYNAFHMILLNSFSLLVVKLNPLILHLLQTTMDMSML
jgi:hypothetical protein